MNKRFFTFLLILMGLSILGVIAVQLVWINNAIRVKNELFDRTVNEALQQTAERLEKRHDIEFIAGLPMVEHIKWNGKASVAPPVPPKPMKIVHKATSPGKASYKFEVSSDNDVRVFAISADIDTTEKQELIIADEDTIITNTQLFVTSRISQLDSLEKVVDTMITVNPMLKKRFEVKTKRLKDLTVEVANEVTTFDEIKVDLEEIQNLVEEELSNKNISIDFELATLENDTINELSSQNDSISLAKSMYQVRLFPNAIFDQNKRLSLFFPELNRYIYRSVSWLLIASLFFSMIILITFALSIFFILKQKKISEMKSDFINNMTHEFKTPIATISVAADSIANKKVISDPEQVNYFLGMIKKENTRMNRQVEDILTIARLDKKDFEFHWETLDIHQLVEEAIQGIILQVEKREGKIDVKLNAGNPMITADRTHCINIIYNLLDNANKYSEDKPQITVTSKNTGKGVILSVIDQGIGMNRQVQSHIFERFYRQTSGNIHNVKGFGLGLSYVKAVL